MSRGGGSLALVLLVHKCRCSGMLYITSKNKEAPPGASEAKNETNKTARPQSPSRRRPRPYPRGAVDPSIATSERGIWAVHWSFVLLIATALVQVVEIVVYCMNTM